MATCALMHVSPNTDCIVAIVPIKLNNIPPLMLLLLLPPVHWSVQAALHSAAAVH